jgi:hypothetical protein
MTHERQPYYKHYPADWRGDANLRLCSLAARGLWQECLGLMHEASPRGYLLFSVEQLATMVSRPLKEVRAALAELEAHGVPSRDAQGRLYSRRMVRDTLRSQTLTANGRRGGHPGLVNQDRRSLVNQESPSLVNQDAHEIDVGLVNQALGTELRTSTKTKTAQNETPPDQELVQAKFETFWEAYGRRGSRKDALKAFTKLNPDYELLATMLDAITRWKASRQWRDPQYQPHASRWLNAEGWTEQVPLEPATFQGSSGGRSEGPPPPPPAAEVLAKMGIFT